MNESLDSHPNAQLMRKEKKNFIQNIHDLNHYHPSSTAAH